MDAMIDKPQHCIRCGNGEGDPNPDNDNQPTVFRSPLALKCDFCNDQRDGERKGYHRLYHRARGRALSRLVDLHPKQFERLLAEEREKIKEEDAAKEAKGARAKAG